MNGDISRAEFRPFGEREANEQRERGNKDRMTEQMSNRFMDGAGNDGNALFFISASSNDGGAGRAGREGGEGVVGGAGSSDKMLLLFACLSVLWSPDCLSENVKSLLCLCLDILPVLTTPRAQSERERERGRETERGRKGGRYLTK